MLQKSTKINEFCRNAAEILKNVQFRLTRLENAEKCTIKTIHEEVITSSFWMLNEKLTGPLSASLHTAYRRVRYAFEPLAAVAGINAERLVAVHDEVVGDLEERGAVAA